MDINDQGLEESFDIRVKEVYTIREVEGSACQEEDMQDNINLLNHELREHLDEVQFKKMANGKSVIYECNQCSKPIKGLFRLRLHMSVHLQSLTCHICDKMFENTNTYQNHMLQHVGNKKQKFGCDQCGECFKGKYHLDRHINSVHTMEKLYVCSQCPMSYFRKDSLKKHLANKHLIMEIPEGCERSRNADKSASIQEFSEKIVPDESESDILDSEVNEEGKYPPNYPIKDFDHTQYKRRLVKGKWIYKCNQCFKQIMGSDRLHKHVLAHMRSTSCEICGKGFKNRSCLLQHMVVHSGHRRFGCPECPQRFHRKLQQQQHILVIHQGFKSNTIFKQKSFTCEICNKVTLGSQHHKRHMMTHTNERPFQCSYCMLSFKRKYHLERHVRTHSGTKPYACPYCSLSYGRGDYLRKHMEVQHLGLELPTEGQSIEPEEEPCRKPDFNDIQIKVEEDDEIELGDENINYSPETYAAVQEKETVVSSRIGLVREDSTPEDYQKSQDNKVEMSPEPSFSNTFNCGICNQIVLTKHSQRHSLVHSEERPFKCSSCSMTFKRPDHLKRHSLRHTHKEYQTVNEDPVKMDHSVEPQGILIKTEKFDDGGDIENDGGTLKIARSDGDYLPVLDESQFHRTVSGDDVMYQCNQCPRIFKGLGRLRLHIVVHEKPTSYPCEKCHKVFRTSECLQHHMVIHSNQKKFGCDECGRRFHRRFELTNHIDIVHKKIKIAPWQAKRAQFTCPICSVVVLSIHQQRHMETHADSRPFSCLMCPQTFKRKYHMDRHVYDVHGITNTDIQGDRVEDFEKIKEENEIRSNSEESHELQHNNEVLQFEITIKSEPDES